MSPCHPFRPVPGQCGPNRRGPLPAPPFDPRDYWATRRLVSSLSGALERKLDKADVVDPGAAAEAGKAADAKGTYGELNGILAKLAKKADMAATLAGYGITDAATKAELAGKADLVGGKVPAAQLPSFVDDVLEYDSKSEFPASGENSKIYVAKDTNLVYRWSGTQYVEISPSPTLDDAVTEESPYGVKSSGIWSWVKSLLPQWLTSDYAEPATAASVAAKADKATTLAGYGITDAVPFVEDANGNKTAVTIGSRSYSSYSSIGPNSLANGHFVDAPGIGAHAEGLQTSAYGNYSHVEGAATKTYAPYSHAGGFSSQTLFDHDYAYAWNGDGAVSSMYKSHGPGTFNINPLDGIKGFYIGESTLYDIMTTKADKATHPTAGNLAALTAVGDLADSGKKPSDFRETTDNTCHKSQLGNVWMCDPPLPEGYEIVRYSDGNTGWQPKLNGNSMGVGKQDPGNTATTLAWAANEWQGGYAFTATRTTVAKSGEPFVTEGSISTNNPAFVSAVQNTPTSGMPEDMPTDWGAFGAVGAALAALAAGLRWCKNILGSLASGYSTFAAWIASKLDRASLLTEYSATSAYSVGAIVCHDGSIYQCKTAVAEGGEAWNEEHWELKKLYDLLSVKADKVAPSAAGNLAALTADGDIEDSGKTVGDFLPRVSDGPVRSTFDISGPLFLDMDGYIQLRSAGFIYGSFNNIREAGDSPISLRTELDSKVGSFEPVGGASATVENGVAKLDDFFKDSNGLLTGTIAAKSIPAFSSLSPYEVGEIVIYGGVAYKCVTAITPAEEWTAAHWTLATNSDLTARLKGLKSDGTATASFVTSILGNPVAKEAIDEEIIDKGTAPDAHLEAPTDERLKLVLADNSVAYDSAKALPYKLTSAIGDRVIATMTLTAASTDITLPTISANDTTARDFILDVTNAYAVEGVATAAGINIPRTDFKLVTRDGESLTDVTTVKAGKSAFICFTQKSPVVVDGTTYPCWCVIQLPFGDPS